MGMLFPVIAQEVHIVEKGETLSEIIYSYTPLPSHKLYNGKLKEITQLNPHIPNIDLIYPGQKIYLKPQKEIPKKIAYTRTPQSIETTQDRFIISFDYGFEYLKFKQQTDIGTYRTDLVLPNLLGATFNTDFKNFGFNARFQTLKFKYVDRTESGSDQLFRFQFGGNYKLFTARFEFNQEPIFSLGGDNFINLSKQTTSWFMVGVTDKNEIKSNKLTFYRYSFLVGIPLSTNIAASAENLSDQVGFKLDAEGEIDRAIASWKSSELLFSLGLGIHYQYQSFKADFEKHSGTTKINLFKTDLFISLKYGF